MKTSQHWGIIGHTWAVEMLREHILHKRVRHAYLFTGPKGIGRRTLALALAQALNCPNIKNSGEPCQTCSTCQRIQAMAYTDLNLVQAEQEGGVLKVEQVRELQRSLALTPYEGQYRVALILRMEEAHPSASNALLKTLEEPNPRVVLALTASDSESLIPTVVSRCEVLRLRPLPVAELSLGLQDRFGYGKEEADLFASISHGCPGNAIRLRNSNDLQNERKEHLEDLLKVLSANRVQRFAIAEKLAKDKENARKELLFWISLLRDVYLQTTEIEPVYTNPDYAVQIKNLGSQLNLSQVHHLITQTGKTLTYTDRNVNLRLALEVLLLDLPRLPEEILR